MRTFKMNLKFDHWSIRMVQISKVISQCIQSVLLAEKVNVPCEINVLVTNDKGIHVINKASRGVDKPTDVLSFPMFQLEAGAPPEDWSSYIDPETNYCPLGDMAISLERAVAQAQEYGHSVRREVGYLTIHSMLHLLGYDHVDEGEEKARMRNREEAIASMIPGMQRD